MRKPAVKKEPTKPVESKPRQKASNELTFDINKISFDLKCKNENQKKFINMISDNTITICAGPAGSGKTFLACAQALKLMKKDSRYTKIILVKSVTVLVGEDIGYIKGSVADKMYEHTLPFVDNFSKIIGEDNTKRMMDMGIIEILPLSHIRGRSIDNSIIIVDESQNISLPNMRSTLTRIGEGGTKMIILGDTKQIDLKDRKLSSLETIINMFEGKTDIGVMAFTKADIVRNKIIMMIEEEFDKLEEAQSKK